MEDVTDEQWEMLSVVKYTDLKGRQSIRDAIATLPECDRTAITLHYMGGMSIKEIARFLGTSAGAIKDRLYRARKRLKKELVKVMETEFAGHKLDAGFTVNLMRILRSLKPIAPSRSTPNIARAIPLSIATAITIIVIGMGLLGRIMQSAPHFSAVLEPGVLESGKQIQVVLTQLSTSASDANAQHPSSGTTQASASSDSSMLTMQTKKDDTNAATSVAEQTDSEKLPTPGELVAEIKRNDAKVRNGMGYLVIQRQAQDWDFKYFYAFDGERLRQDEILKVQGREKTYGQTIFDGEKLIKKPEVGKVVYIDFYKPTRYAEISMSLPPHRFVAILAPQSLSTKRQDRTQ
ncbi:MAG: RNA polymerase sigma factor [Candidatus Poribacteria bacterium]